MSGEMDQKEVAADLESAVIETEQIVLDLNEPIQKVEEENQNQPPAADPTPEPVAGKKEETPVKPTEEEGKKPDGQETVEEFETFESLLTPNVQTPEAQAEDVVKIKQELDQYKSQFEDPFIKSYLEAKALPDFDVAKFASEFVPPSYSGVPLEDLLRQKIKSQFPSISEEDVEQEIQDEMGKASTAVKKAALRADVENYLKSKAPQKGGELAEKLKAQREAIQLQQQEAERVYLEEHNKFLSAVKGKKLYGVEVNDGVLKSFEDVVTGKKYQTTDGKPNWNAIMQDQMKLAMWDDLVKAVKKQGKIEAALERGNASSTTAVQQRAEPAPLSDEEAINKDVGGMNFTIS